MHEPMRNPTELHEKAARRWREAQRADTESERDEEAGRAVAFEVPIVWEGPTSRAMNWARALEAYEMFWRTSRPRRAPRENSRNRSSLPRAEGRLGEWARYQRRFQDRLSEFQRIRLTASPAFHWDPVEAAWMTHLELCRLHYVIHRRLPLLNGDNAEEFALARWLNRQLRQLQMGTQPPARASFLAEVLSLPSSADK
ncbi:hypothetical protein [Frigoribacterium sp. UYMn621]|uniref:hypothetical protein n=1 Tax=Frigoribacterium sp. UYMn621 TaxID=3156343 RepID=UPI003393E563